MRTSSSRSSSSSYSTELAALSRISMAVGLTVMIFLACKWSCYLTQLHENQSLFSELTESERELTFRTEMALYYSYFKHLVLSPNLNQGIDDLRNDNVTEHLRTINIFRRFNIHPELVLALIYRSSLISSNLSPILFYSYFVFALQGLFLCALFAISWIMSGTWLSGVLTAAFAVCHRNLVTRVDFTLALREHFSFPFILSQFALVGRYLESKNVHEEKYYLGTIYILTVLFSVPWQFAQFVLLLQVVTLYGLAVIQVLQSHKVCKLLAVFYMSILTNWFLQYYQPMVLTSLVASLIPVAFVVLLFLGNQGGKFRPGVWKNLVRAACKLLGSLAVASLLNTVIKLLIGQDADSHIFRFVQSKFGRDDETDFETMLYLCLPTFQTLGLKFFVSMSKSGAMPIYLLSLSLGLACIVGTVFKRWSKKEKDEDEEEDVKRNFGWLEESEETRIVVQDWNRPEMCYHIGQSLLLAALALSTSRMRFFWSPYICVFAGAGIANVGLWNFLVTATLGSKRKTKDSERRLLVNFIRHVVIACVLVALYLSHRDSFRRELHHIERFSDPDTVELMSWIDSATPPDSAFSGSMQLMAQVRLSGGRPITNHPHFEDQELRDRSRDLFQIYAKKSAEEVHDILIGYNSSYIILEDGICRGRDRCSTPGIMDLSNGHIP